MQATATTTTTATRTRRTARRTPQQIQRPQAQQLSPEVVLRTHIAWLKREACDVEANLASLTHTAVQIGEASGWRDARLPALDETIHYWKNRYLALTQQISTESARVALALAMA